MNANEREFFVCAPAAHCTRYKAFAFICVFGVHLRTICFLLLDNIRGDSSGSEPLKAGSDPEQMDLTPSK